jgi:hypothetical protein
MIRIYLSLFNWILVFILKSGGRGGVAAGRCLTFREKRIFAQQKANVVSSSCPKKSAKF